MKLTKTYLKRIITEVMEQYEGKTVFKNAQWSKELSGTCNINGKITSIKITPTSTSAVVGIDGDGDLFIPFKVEIKDNDGQRRIKNTNIYPSTPNDIEVIEDPKRQPSEERILDPYRSNIDSFGFDFV